MDRRTVTQTPKFAELPTPAKRATRVVAAALVTLSVLTGCSKVVDGTLSMKTEGLSTDISCADFIALGENERVKVVTQILQETHNSTSAQRPFVMVTLAGVLCQGMPDMQLKTLLSRMRVR
jgi:hypothetical protein